MEKERVTVFKTEGKFYRASDQGDIDFRCIEMEITQDTIWVIDAETKRVRHKCVIKDLVYLVAREMEEG